MLLERLPLRGVHLYVQLRVLLQALLEAGVLLGLSPLRLHGFEDLLALHRQEVDVDGDGHVAPSGPDGVHLDRRSLIGTFCGLEGEETFLRDSEERRYVLLRSRSHVVPADVTPLCAILLSYITRITIRLSVRITSSSSAEIG